MKKHRYRVLKAAGIPALQSKVDVKLGEGWECSGGVFIISDGAWVGYYQAMTNPSEMGS